MIFLFLRCNTHAHSSNSTPAPNRLCRQGASAKGRIKTLTRSGEAPVPYFKTDAVCIPEQTQREVYEQVLLPRGQRRQWRHSWETLVCRMEVLHTRCKHKASNLYSDRLQECFQQNKISGGECMTTGSSSPTLQVRRSHKSTTASNIVKPHTDSEFPFSTSVHAI